VLIIVDLNLNVIKLNKCVATNSNVLKAPAFILFRKSFYHLLVIKLVCEKALEDYKIKHKYEF